ncbi:hypothetical protein D5085_02445 [Ectothiorhodospiraceae bacterium BW-2]|nr:hypothetical protein D5085_02445 [Ectothiorhodospiraceae bacterium BW-2]
MAKSGKKRKADKALKKSKALKSVKAKSKKRLAAPLVKTEVERVINLPPSSYEAVSEANAAPLLYDTALMTTTQQQWQSGDWPALAALSLEQVENHPERAKLALLAAAGQLQQGESVLARQYIRVAKSWGAEKGLIGRVLVGGTYNSLGRAAALGLHQQQALQHFQSSVTVGTFNSTASSLVISRAHQELSRLGLRLGKQGEVEPDSAYLRLKEKPLQPMPVPELRPVGAMQQFYHDLAQRYPVGTLPFLLIDSKSLPRSGLHYLKNTLARLFGEHFSFCEWYQEAGCCQQMPCALSGFATYAQEQQSLRIRLLKSHDFALSDPDYETNHYVRRLVLVRDPLYILTSWFVLEQLAGYKDVLAQNGISINKIWLSHEKEILKPAYQLLNDHFIPPDESQLVSWLEAKSCYIAGFLQKWCKSQAVESVSAQVVHYEAIPHYIASLAAKFRSSLPVASLAMFDESVAQVTQQFKQRQDPFSSPVEKISDYMRQHAVYFEEIGERLRRYEANSISERYGNWLCGS